MVDQQLQPFSAPTSLAMFLPGGVSSGMLVEWALYLVFAFWVIYTLVVIYHWLSYSHSSIVAFPSIALHLFISFVLIVFALTGTRVI